MIRFGAEARRASWKEWSFVTGEFAPNQGGVHQRVPTFHTAPHGGRLRNRRQAYHVGLLAVRQTQTLQNSDPRTVIDRRYPDDATRDFLKMVRPNEKSRRRSRRCGRRVKYPYFYTQLTVIVVKYPYFYSSAVDFSPLACHPGTTDATQRETVQNQY